MNTHVIVRLFSGCPGKVGDEVDASGWRNARLLEAGRYIQPIPPERQASAEPASGSKSKSKPSQGVEHSAAQSATAKRGLE